MVPTAKNRESKRKYGLTQLDIEYFILSLKADNLYKEQEVDRNYHNETLYLYKKKKKKNVVFYVKLKFKDGVIKILSCHEDEQEENMIDIRSRKIIANVKGKEISFS